MSSLAGAVGGPTREFVLRADFDLLDEEGCAWVSVRFLRGPRPPREDELVYLMDSRGNGCTGLVEAVSGWYVRVRPNWATWTGGPIPAVAFRDRRAA